MPHLVWFRNDLRTADNPALSAACSRSRTDNQPVRALFIITPGQWREHDWSPARVRHMLGHLDDLGHSLAKLGIPLDILEGDDFAGSIRLLTDYCYQHGIRALHFNDEYGINERRRDKQVRDQLVKVEVAVNKYRDQTVAPVGTIRTGKDEPYSVFTPFSRRWRQWIEDTSPSILPVPDPTAEPCPWSAHGHTPEKLGFCAAPPALVTPTESGAHNQLESFLDERGGNYKATRDFPAVDGTSLVSPYLAIGALSGRQCLVAAREAQAHGGNQEGFTTWINEIAWRDFYIHILYHYPRVSMHRAFKPETEALRWNEPGEQFEAWKEGRTGIPIVDAAMRQLRETGWMHNRLRMITAMFLSKNLFLDWRLGEAWFMQNLVDGFLASNNGGWQWSASTGTDAAPYFRVFNPVTQSERFDPKGEFIRRWIPELAELDNKRIHNPSAGGVIPGGYPRPIVDLKESRKEAIARFEALKN
ncbi:deoxyribodipyrimidine photo-lyase [Marinobacter sp.]|uniref:deoxyribodipyrimidine photo-lyase n=1 Tax=Marinobacter sp. TaxID=50741 RepID=UPI00356256C2